MTLLDVAPEYRCSSLWLRSDNGLVRNVNLLRDVRLLGKWFKSTFNQDNPNDSAFMRAEFYAEY